MEIIPNYSIYLVIVLILPILVHHVCSFEEVGGKTDDPKISLQDSVIDKPSDSIHPVSFLDAEAPLTVNPVENLEVVSSETHELQFNSEKNHENIPIKEEENIESHESNKDYIERNQRSTRDDDLLSRELLKAFDFTKYKISPSSDKKAEDKNLVDTSAAKGSSKASNPEDIVKENEDGAQREEDEDSVTSKKPRYFPLLYSFGSLVSSFLAEFAESPSSRVSTKNSSVSGLQNSTTEENLQLDDNNATTNGTDQKKKSRFQCCIQYDNLTDTNITAEVQIINSTELMEILNFSKYQKSSSSPCVVVMFFTKWCRFSARAAPEYNALARAFPLLDILAVDTSHFSYLNAKFGTVAVPNIMLFHSRSAVRFNHTTRTLDNFVQFIVNNTGLDPVESVVVLPEDYDGPLSSKVEEGRDWLLWLSWVFILVCSIYAFFFSLYGQAIIARLTVLWQEHQHIE